jgi:DnaK suppressor protein
MSQTTLHKTAKKVKETVTEEHGTSQSPHAPTKQRPTCHRSERSGAKPDLSNPDQRAETLRAEYHRRACGVDNLESQRQSLLALRARLRGDVVERADAALARSVETTSASPDSADLASETIEQDLAMLLLGSTVGTLDQIEAAFERIEDGSYGRCAECQTRIPSARLEAIPYATCCVECAARRERAA